MLKKKQRLNLNMFLSLIISLKDLSLKLSEISISQTKVLFNQWDLLKKEMLLDLRSQSIAMIFQLRIALFWDKITKIYYLFLIRISSLKFQPTWILHHYHSFPLSLTFKMYLNFRDLQEQSFMICLRTIISSWIN